MERGVLRHCRFVSGVCWQRMCSAGQGVARALAWRRWRQARIGAPTDVDLHKLDGRLWAGRIFPKKSCCRLKARCYSVPLARPCPQAKVHQDADGRAGEETSSGCDPALSRIWFGSPITVASGGGELVAPWTPERVA